MSTEKAPPPKGQSNDKPKDPLGLVGVTLLDRYRVEAWIAKGGMSVVHRGMDLRLHRPVCIKVFHRLDPRELIYQAAYEHFVQEAFALSQLSHPNTLRIYDFGYLERTPALPFQVSELCDGGTLNHLMKKRGRLEPDEMLAVAEPLCAALREAHGRGVVHRDLKPGNILFSIAGNERIVKLCDFGIAKTSSQDQGGVPFHVETGASGAARLSLFTPGWAAPEQLRGETIGPAVDVYALGLLVAFMLSGQTVFRQGRDTDAYEERLAGDAHVDKRVTLLGLPAPLAEVVRRACRDQPGERFASVTELGLALKAATQVLGTQPTPSPRRAPPPPPLPRAGGSVATPPPEPHPLLTIDATTGTGDILAGGRRVRLVELGAPLDAGGDSGPLRSRARFRVALLPDPEKARVHVKGLNCFVARAGSRPSAAVDLYSDGELELLAPDRTRLDVVRLSFGTHGAGERHFDLGPVTLAVASHFREPVMLDLGPGRELALLHRLPQTSSPTPTSPSPPTRGRVTNKGAAK
jgi:serine/threonine-protein kinase